MPEKKKPPTFKDEKTTPPREGLFGLWSPLFLAKEVGEKLERSQILQRTMQTK